MRKPRDLETGFWDGYAQWCDWSKETALEVNLKLGSATPPELRRMAKWMLRAADYIDFKKGKKK